MSYQLPYLSKYTTIGPIVVWFVDGTFVRKEFDEEFTNFSHHYRFPFIPKNEFWIDKEYAPGEALFFVDHLLVEYHLMENGMSYEDAITAADGWEQKERAKSDLARELAVLKRTHNPALYDKIRKAPFGDFVVPGLAVWVINGEAVRDAFYIDFTCGGHEYVYDFVPAGEVWLDDDFSQEEQRFILLHELHERRLMRGGMQYPDAHASSSALEYQCRHAPHELPVQLTEEWQLNCDPAYARL